MIPPRFFLWTGFCHGVAHLVYGFDWYSSTLYVTGTSPLWVGLYNLNNDHIPEVDPWAAANILY
jgi:hypothetical protein